MAVAEGAAPTGLAGVCAMDDLGAPEGGTGAAGAAEGDIVGALGVDAAGVDAAGILIEGPPAGFGGKLMRTVCFFWAASAGLGGSGAGDGVGGIGLFSDIKRALAHAMNGLAPVSNGLTGGREKVCG